MAIVKYTKFGFICFCFSLVLYGCQYDFNADRGSGSQIRLMTVEREYRNLVGFENRFDPGVLMQDPKEATYVSELIGCAGQFDAAMWSYLGVRGPNNRSKAVVKNLCRKYGVAAYVSRADVPRALKIYLYESPFPRSEFALRSEDIAPLIKAGARQSILLQEVEKQALTQHSSHP